jgi:thymidylate synthase ThyX
MTPDGFESFMQKSAAEILEEVAYMATTIPSSWEMADLIFSIEQVSRATAQQITRTRTASFAMQSQRVADMSDVTWDRRPHDAYLFDAAMSDSINSYKEAVRYGTPLEDARDLLPIGVHCNLIAKYNLRGLVELCRARDSLRVQGAYRDVCAQMKVAVLSVWPWAATFFEPPNEKAIKMIEEIAVALKSEEGAMYRGISGKLAKAADLLKKG